MFCCIRLLQPQLFHDKQKEKLKQVAPIKKTPILEKIELTGEDKPVFLQQEKYSRSAPREVGLCSMQQISICFASATPLQCHAPLMQPLNKKMLFRKVFR